MASKDDLSLTHHEWAIVSQALKTQRAVVMRAAKAESDSEIRALKERQGVRLDALIAKISNLSLL